LPAKSAGVLPPAQDWHARFVVLAAKERLAASKSESKFPDCDVPRLEVWRSPLSLPSIQPNPTLHQPEKPSQPSL
jgi:hypothetical protein